MERRHQGGTSGGSEGRRRWNSLFSQAATTPDIFRRTSSSFSFPSASWTSLVASSEQDWARS